MDDGIVGCFDIECWEVSTAIPSTRVKARLTYASVVRFSLAAGAESCVVPSVLPSELCLC